MIEKALKKLTRRGIIISKENRKIVRETLADYAFAATIDSAVREEAHCISDATSKAMTRCNCVCHECSCCRE